MTSKGYGVVLRQPRMKAVTAVHTVSMLGTFLAGIALALLVYDRTQSPALASLTVAAQLVPSSVSGLLLSGLADRARPRTVLVACDTLSFLLVGLMVVPGLPVAALISLIALQGLVGPIFSGARSATLADTLPPDVYPLARSLLRLINQASQLTGYALAGVLVALFGPRPVLAVDALSFALSAVVLFVVTGDVPRRAASGLSTLRQSREGLGLVLRSRQLRGWLGLTGVSLASTSPLDAFVIPYVAVRHGSPSTVGLLFATFGAGSVIGELVGARLSPAWRLRAITPGLLVGPLLVASLVVAPPLWVVGVVCVGCGFSNAGRPGVDAHVLAATPPHARGRVAVLEQTTMMTTQGLTILLSGFLAQVLPVQVAVSLVATAGIVTIVPWLRRLNAGSATHGQLMSEPRGLAHSAR